MPLITDGVEYALNQYINSLNPQPDSNQISGIKDGLRPLFTALYGGITNSALITDGYGQKGKIL